ncbi:MAG TPA: tetratricopeptide repeat protein [Ohtaekwangia sp.]|nr:tetratricopeptide repeat protein [Ohtaekwangia sp.]
MNRLRELQKFLDEDPHDPFNRYALALEYQKTDTAKAIELFEQLVREHGDYLPVYYAFGKLSDATGDRQKAIDVFKRGIEKARDQQQHKTLRELQSALDELLYE